MYRWLPSWEVAGRGLHGSILAVGAPLAPLRLVLHVEGEKSGGAEEEGLG
jgi:hypothetical protein